MAPTLTHLLQTTGLVSSASAKVISESFSEMSLSKGVFFLIEGKISGTYLFLEDGYMRAFVHDTEGNEVTTGFFQPGQVVFEVSSFFNRQPSRENIKALTDCTGLYITYDELNGLFHSLEEFREFGRHILVKGYTAYKDRTLSLITHTAEERYAMLLKTNPEIFQHAALKHIASYLGITDTSLSRIRKDFSKK